MSGTSGSLNMSSGGVVLPAPKVQLFVPALGAADVSVAKVQPSSGGLVQINLVRRCKVTVPGMSQEILDNTAEYDPQLELLRFVRRKSSDRASSGNGAKTSAYVHPAHGPAASGNGSFTHGGAHGGTAPVLTAVRETEWPLLTDAKFVDVTQGMWSFMCWADDIAYRDSTGNYAPFSGVYPAEMAAQRRRLSGRRFPYSSAYSPGYFAFRISIKDPSDQRGKRIHGPVSQTVRLVNEKFPFNPAGLEAGSNRALADLSKGYDSQRGNMFFVTRLP